MKYQIIRLTYATSKSLNAEVTYLIGQYDTYEAASKAAAEHGAMFPENNASYEIICRPEIQL